MQSISLSDSILIGTFCSGYVLSMFSFWRAEWIVFLDFLIYMFDSAIVQAPIKAL